MRPTLCSPITCGRGIVCWLSPCCHPEAVGNLVADVASSFQSTGSREPGTNIPGDAAAIGSP